MASYNPPRKVLSVFNSSDYSYNDQPITLATLGSLSNNPNLLKISGGTVNNLTVTGSLTLNNSASVAGIVDLNSSQTIGGNKTFSQPLTVQQLTFPSYTSSPTLQSNSMGYVYPTTAVTVPSPLVSGTTYNCLKTTGFLGSFGTYKLTFCVCVTNPGNSGNTQVSNFQVGLGTSSSTFDVCSFTDCSLKTIGTASAWNQTFAYSYFYQPPSGTSVATTQLFLNFIPTYTLSSLNLVPAYCFLQVCRVA